MPERLQKYMARCGIASRRKCEEIIAEGRVEVNGKTVMSVVTVEEGKDKVKVDGKSIAPETQMAYIILNKPEDVITTADDQFHRTTVLDIVKVKERIFPVGRLDFDTSGLLLLTNDGDLANKLMHPSKEIEKVYIAKVKGIPDQKDIDAFAAGMRIGKTKMAPAELKIMKVKLGNSEIRIKIHEGKYHQIKIMCDEIEHPVKKLRRIRIGDLTLEGLGPGEWRYLTKKEVEYLKSL